MEQGGYYTTADDAEPLIVRQRVMYDQPMPVRQRHHDLGADRLG